jgi:KUP system potassium uptake protein
LKVPNISQSAITGISEAILVMLFCVQPFGTTKIASSFAPVVIVWLLFNFSVGMYNIITQDYTVLSAFSPYWIYAWFARNGQEGWVSMGGILLAFTGVEALFADLGHFSRASVQISWCFLAYPVSMVNEYVVHRHLASYKSSTIFSACLLPTLVKQLTYQTILLVLHGAIHSLQQYLLR